MREMIGTTLGKYSIVGLLGKGGMANVYRAHQPRLDRYVAIKVLHGHLAEDPDFVGRFEREATAVARLNHPGIVKIYDFDAEDGLYYMVMELVDGPTLRGELHARAEKKQPFTLGEVGRIILPIAEAVTYAHAHGVVHRDLKPANVMLTSDGRVVVTDFGLAHIVGTPQLTKVGTTSGTPEYMSPEQGRGYPGDERSDIYSLGVILYEMVSGRVPFTGETPLAIITSQISDAPAPPSQFSGELPPLVEGVILTALAKEPAERYASIEEMGTALQQALDLAGRPAEPLAILAPARTTESGFTTRTPSTDLRGSRPYRGLFAFREEDALFFYGREVFTERLLEAVRESSRVAVVGPSGSGKSSVVFAGLVPRLRGEGDWTIVHFRPGSRPFQALAGALVALLEPDLGEVEHLVATGKMAQALAEGSLALGDVIARFLYKPAPATSQTEADTLYLSGNDHLPRLLLVADQFEELYTLCAEPEVRQHFTAALLAAVSPGAASPCILVLTLRADFMGQVLADRPFADALQKSDVKLGPMTREELGRAIEQPAGRLGVSFEPGLVERILDDVGNEPGNLPLLEFALALVWDRRAGRRLTHAAYEAIGRVEGSLARYADKVYARLSDDEKQGARRLFTQMVRPGEGTEDTRRQATRGEIGESDWPLAQRLADERLAVTGRDATGQETVEVIHEALIRGWRRLQEWMNADRAFRAWQERLRAALHQWEDGGRDEALLLRGPVLAEAENWRLVRGAELNTVEQALIQASAELREREAAEKQAQRERELEAARKLAEAERSRAETQALAARKLRQRAWFLTGALAIAVVLAVLAGVLGDQARRNAQHAEEQRQAAVTQQAIAEEQRGIAETQRAEAVARRQEAEEQRAIAEEQRRLSLSRQLAAQSATLLAKQLDLALLLALESNRITDTAETRGSLLTALQQEPRLLTFLRPSTQQVQEVAFSLDGSRMASVGGGGIAILWTVEYDADGWPVFTKEFDLVGHDPTQLVNAASFSPDGTMLATCSDDFTVKIWDVATGQELRTLTDPTDFVQSIAFSPDGTTLVGSGGGGSVYLWDVDTWALARTLPGAATETTWHVVFSPDGETLAVVNYYGSVSLWDWRAGQRRIEPLAGFPGLVVRAAFSPDGQTLAMVGEGNVIWFRDVATGTPTGAITTTHEIALLGVAFTPDGASVVTRGGEGGIIRWDLATGAQIGATLPGNTGQIINVVLSPDGRLVVSSDSYGRILVWDLEENWQLYRPFAGHRGRVYTVAFSPDGSTVVSSSQDGTVLLRDVVTGEVVATLAHTSPELPELDSVALTPDGQVAYAAYADGGVAVWPLDQAEGQWPTTLNIHGHLVTAMSPDGTVLAIGDTSGRVALWDAAAGQAFTTAANATDAVTSLALSTGSEFFAIGREGGTVRLWKLENNRYLPAATLAGPGGPVRSVALAADGQFLAAGGEDGTIVVWSVASGEETARIAAAHSGTVLALSWGPAGLLSAGLDGSVVAWDVAQDPPARQLILAGVQPPAQAAFYSATVALGYADGTLEVWDLGQPQARLLTTANAGAPVAGLALGVGRVAAGTADGTVQVWDLAGTASPLAWTPTTTAPSSVFEFALSPDGKVLVSGGNNGTVLLWDVASGQLRSAPRAGHTFQVTASAFSPDGQAFATGACGRGTDSAACDLGEILLWKLDGGEPVRLLGHKGFVYAVAFSPDGRILASGSCSTIDVGGFCLQGEVIFWDVATGQPIGEPIAAHTRELYAVAFSPDGRLLATGSLDTSIMLWDVATHQQAGQSLLGHPGAVTGLAFRPDGAVLASGSYGAQRGNQYDPGPVILWDVATGQRIGPPLLGHQHNVWTVAFSPDGQWLASGSSDTMVLLWDLRPATWRERACRVANRNMTPQEWTQFFATEAYQETCGE